MDTQGMVESLMPKPLPSQDYLRECFAYEPETGYLRWRRRPVEHFPYAQGARMWLSRFPGEVAGAKDRCGHLQVVIDHRTYQLQRIIWKLVTGEDPPSTVDHVNHVRDDNRWSNLRLATHQEQVWNRTIGARKPTTSGFRGVTKHGNKWRARVYIGGKVKLLCGFATAEEAGAAWKAAAKEAYGEFYTT